MRRTLALLLLGLSGCARLPAPLPSATPEQLPDAWLAPLRERPCPETLKANLRCRVVGKDASPVTVDGTLLLLGPDTLQVNGSYGPFRPLFALAADRDSAELLVHEQRRFWTVPRSSIDWALFNPAALARALAWSICPADLLARFQPRDKGRMEQGLWRVSGRATDLPYEVRLGINPEHAMLEEIRFLDGDEEILGARLLDPTRAGTHWMPSRVELRTGRDGPALQIEILRPRSADRGRDHLSARIRPPGWIAVGMEGMPLDLPPPGKRLPGSP